MSAVLCDIRDGVARITLNRPAIGNAIDDTLAVAFGAAVDRISADASVRAVLMTGAGRMFCAGGDIAGMRAGVDDLPASLGAMLPTLHAAVLKLAQLPVPVVTALNGPVGGGGIALALCSDLVLAARSFKLRGGYSAIGLSPDLGASWFLAQRAGPLQARRILFLNEPLDADRCLALGLVDAVHDDDRLAAEADALAARLAASATLSLAKIKRLTAVAPSHSLEAHLAMEAEGMIASGGTADAREGVTAFIEKRAPRFTGR